MAAYARKTMDVFEEHVVDGESREVWLAIVISFGALYKTSRTSVYSIDDMIKVLPSRSVRM